MAMFFVSASHVLEDIYKRISSSNNAQAVTYNTCL